MTDLAAAFEEVAQEAEAVFALVRLPFAGKVPRGN